MTNTRSAGLAALLASALALAASAQEAASPAPDPRGAGPALRAALALLATEPARGRARLAEVAREYPIVADHAAYQALASHAAEQDHARVAELAAAFRSAHTDSPLRGRAAALDAEAAVALGDEPRAREAFAVARRAAASREERAAFALASARSLEREQAHAAAAQAFLAVWRDEAPTPAAADAWRALEGQAPAAGTGAGVVTASDWGRRCRELFAAYWNDGALRACDAALASDALAASERRRLSSLRADLLFRDRRYSEAERAFAALPDSSENRFMRARALARSGRLDEAKAAFERLGQTRDDWGARALFLAGTLYEDDDVAKASERYRQALAQAKRAELRIEARWKLAWRAYLEKRWDDAARDLAELARDTADPVEALRARYWEARALAQRGDAQGIAKLAALAQGWGFTYYGQRSQALAQGSEPASASSAPAAPALVDDAGAAPLEPDALLRPRILLEAGLIGDAGAEALSLAGRARRSADRLALAELFQDAGLFDAAQRVILDAYALPLSAGPRGGAPDLWWAAYPQAFATEVERAAASAGIPPQLLFAVMREESGFRPEVLSVVGARGLVQIMPETGRKLAERLGAASYSPEELFVPARNLELGAAYLAELLARFEGRVSAAVASYNAGPEAVERWLAQGSALEDDAWIESIPYDQTRAYAKRVLRSFAIYQTLY
jgi:soluble lytic murein transglycosylase